MGGELKISPKKHPRCPMYGLFYLHYVKQLPHSKEHVSKYSLLIGHLESFFTQLSPKKGHMPTTTAPQIECATSAMFKSIILLTILLAAGLILLGQLTGPGLCGMDGKLPKSMGDCNTPLEGSIRKPTRISWNVA